MYDCPSTGSRHLHCTRDTLMSPLNEAKMNQKSKPSQHCHHSELYSSIDNQLTVRVRKNVTTHQSISPVTICPSLPCKYTSNRRLVTPVRCKVHMKGVMSDTVNKCVTCVPCNNCKYTSTAKGELELTSTSFHRFRHNNNGHTKPYYTSAAIKLVVILSNVLLPLLLLLSRNVSSSAALPNYQSKLTCEGSQLYLSCDDGYKLNIIRANFGRFSLSPCNPQGNAEWPANCMSRKSFRVAQDACGNRTECTLHASASVFGDPCPSATKYLEVQYQCLAEVIPTASGGNLRPSLHSTNVSPGVTSTNGNSGANVNDLNRSRNLPTSGKSSSANSGVSTSGTGNNSNVNGRNRGKVSPINSVSSASSSSEYDSSEDRRSLSTNFTLTSSSSSSPATSSSSSVPHSSSPALTSRPNHPESSSSIIGAGTSNNVASYGDSMASNSHSASGNNNNNNNNGHRQQQQQQQQNNDDRNSVNSDTLNLDHSSVSSSSSGISSSSPSPSSLPHHHSYPHTIIVPTPNFNPSVNSQLGNNNQFVPPSIEPAIPNHHHHHHNSQLANSTGNVRNSLDTDDYEGTSSSLDSVSNYNDVTSTLSSSALPLPDALRVPLTIGCVFGIICLFLTMLSLAMTSASTSSSASSPSSSHLLNSSTIGNNSASAAAAVLSTNNHSPAIECGLLVSPCRSFTKSLRLELQVKQNLTLCLLIVEILLLIGINVSQNKFFCGIIAGTLHYFFLSIFIWLFFDGFTLYLALLKHQEVNNVTGNSSNGTVQLNHSPNSGSVLDVTSTVNRTSHRVNSAQYSTQLSANGDLITSAHKSYQVPISRDDNCCSRSAKCYLALAYGLPLVIQVTSSLLDTGSLFWISSSLTHCWLRSDKYFVLTFVGPVIAVLSANFLFLAITVVCSNYGSLFSSFDKFALDEHLSHASHHRSHHHLSYNGNLPVYINDYTIYTSNSLRKRLRTSLTIFVVMSLTLTALFVSLCQELPDDDLIFTSCLYTFALFNPIQVIVMLILFSSSTSIAKANSLRVLTSLGLFNGDSSHSHHNSASLSLGNDKSNMALTTSSMNHGHGGHGHSVIHSTLLGGASANGMPTNNLNALNSLDNGNSASAVRYVNTVGKDMQQMLMAHHSINGNSCHSSDLPIIPPPIHTSTLNLSDINGCNGGNGNTGTISSTGADGGSIQSKPYSASDYGFRKNLGSTSVSLTYRSPVYGTTSGNNATLISTSTPSNASCVTSSSSGVTVTTTNTATQASLAASIAMRRAAVNAAGASVHVHTKQCLQLPCPYPHVVEHVYESIDDDPYVARLLLPVSTPMINRKLTNGNANNLNC